MSKLCSIDDVLDALVELEVITSKEIRETRTPTHGTCCTCQVCGWWYDECVCTHNAILKKLKSIETFDARNI